MAEKYIIVPGTQQKIYEGTVVVLFRLPNLKWILHNGYYNYGGKRRRGWYFSSIPADSAMPVFQEDLVNLRIVDEPGPCPPYPPFPPVPPIPPVPIPTPFTPADKKQLDAAMLTFEDIEARDRFSGDWLINGKIVRVNNSDGEGNPEYYSWNSETSSWDEASLGYRYMTRHEITQAIADDIVAITWADEYGALVLTNNGGTAVEPVQLKGVAHDPVFTQENLTLRIPIYGKEDFKMTIPRDTYIRAIRFEPEYHFLEPEPHIGPAIVVTVSNGDEEYEIAGDATDFYNIYEGAETPTTKVIIETDTSKIKCNVKISSIVDNPLKVDNEGMWVDLSGVVAKQPMDAGMLLVSDGNGQFTYGGNGIGINTSTAISDLMHPEKFVVTANLIVDAIDAALGAFDILIEEKIEGIERRITDIEERIDFGSGEDGEILMTSGDSIKRTGYKVGGNTLSPDSDNTVPTEKAVADALAWIQF